MRVSTELDNHRRSHSSFGHLSPREHGDFTPLGFPGGIDPWFTHQHGANYLGTTELILFDNGNRNDACLADAADCVNRGQV
jgi:hypothetical protein